MTNYSNIAGTSFASFQIALGGPVIYQGQADPTVTPPTLSPQQGDLYFRHTVANQIWSYNGVIWEDTSTTFTGGTISGDLDVSGQIASGDPILVLNDGEAGPGATGGPSGLEVDRGPVDPNAQWIWDEIEDWWTPSGFADDIHSGRILLDTGATPALTFVGDTATGIFSNAAGTISLTNGTETWTMDSVGTLVPTGPGSRNVGTIANHSASIYSNRFFGDPAATTVLPHFSFIGDDDTGMGQTAGNNLALYTAGNPVVELDPTGNLTVSSIGAQIFAQDGAVGSPGYAFDNATDTGLFLDTADLVISRANSEVLRFDANDATFSTTQVNIPSGNLTDPGLVIGAGNDVGFNHGTNPGELEIVGEDSTLTSNVVKLLVDEDGLLVADPADVASGGYEALVDAGGDNSIPSKKWVQDNAGTIPLYEQITGLAGTPLIGLSTVVYTPGADQLVVYLNGQKMVVTINYTETSGTSVTWVSPTLVATDIVEFYSSGVSGNSIARYAEYVGTAVVAGVLNTVIPTVSNVNNGAARLQVFVNGILQQEGVTKNYTVTGPTQITFNVTINAADDIVLYAF